MIETLNALFSAHPDLRSCEKEIRLAYQVLAECYRGGGKALICGNGGSAADSEHIVGELMKDFLVKRPLPDGFKDRLIREYGDEGRYLADHLQGALPAISLVSQTSLATAFANDIAPDLVFAQQVYGYGKPGDVLVGISTSGRSENVLHALRVARLCGMGTIGLTGGTGGRMGELCDVTLCVPADSTPAIQEQHLPIYHTLCILLEKEFFTHEVTGRR